MTDSTSASKASRFWTWIIVAAALLQLPTLSMSPVVWQDEVQTIEYGRQLFDGATDASVVLESGLRPAGSLNYLGSWLQEAMFRLAGGSYLAPRLVNLLAATAAALLAAAWLKNRGVIAPAASLAALLFFIDPCFERSYRGGRIEGLVFLVVMAFCWLLSQPSGKSRWHPWLAGALAGVIPWMWATAVLLLPLLALETWHAARQSPNARAVLLPVLVGGLVSGLLCMWPVAGSIASLFESTFTHVRWDARSSNAAAAGSGWVGSVLSVLRYSPFLPLLALAGGARRAMLPWGLAGLAALGVVVGTRFYLYRYLYVLPYLMLLAAPALAGLVVAIRQGGWRGRLAASFTALACAWPLLLSLGARGYVAVQERAWRDHDLLLKLAREEIGTGSPRVYLGSFDWYFAGRELGWQMYREKTVISDADMEKLTRKCDLVMLVAEQDTPERRAMLRRAGYDEGTTLQLHSGEVPAAFQRPRYGGLAYQPVRLYRKRSTAPPGGGL